ncbi:hypothetical protein F5Y06DRAFT_198630 [Hypoxylon sp. FL0890]|nr:hypothetical protein F5Y06DRAFT_198630 [Hypoxylon sp. FL0890]
MAQFTPSLPPDLAAEVTALRIPLVELTRHAQLMLRLHTENIELRAMIEKMQGEMKDNFDRVDRNIANANLRLRIHTDANVHVTQYHPMLRDPPILESPDNLKAWIHEMHGKLLVDGKVLFPSAELRFRYVYSRLHPEAQAFVTTQLEWAQVTGHWDYKDIFNILKCNYKTDECKCKAEAWARAKEDLKDFELE